MTLIGILQIVVFFAIIIAITKPIGVYMYKVFEGQKTFLHRALFPIERLIYWLGGVRAEEEQTWVRYSASLISLSIFSFLFVYFDSSPTRHAAAESDALLDGPGTLWRNTDDA